MNTTEAPAIPAEVRARAAQLAQSIVRECQAPQPQEQPAEAPMIFAEADRVVIGTPCYGGSVKMGYLTSYADALTKVSIRIAGDKAGESELQPLVAEAFLLDKESHIDRARNKIANKFLQTSYNWLLFFDSDIVAPPMALGRLWQHAMRLNLGIVTAPYALKGVVPTFAINGINGAKPGEDGLVEVVHAGTGFMLIHRRVFAELDKAGLAEEYNLGTNDPDVHTLKTSKAYFKSGVREVRPNHKIWLSEDYMLCHEWRKLGGKVFTDTKIALSHIGDLTYPAQPKEIVAAMREIRRINHPDCPQELI